jgi:hypothetical protein
LALLTETRAAALAMRRAAVVGLRGFENASRSRGAGRAGLSNGFRSAALRTGALRPLGCGASGGFLR